jgi:hypothetical protein
MKPLLIDNKWEPQKYLDAIDRCIQEHQEKISYAEQRIVAYTIERKRVEALIKEHEASSTE